MMLNAASEPVTFCLPESRWAERWRVVIDTTTGQPADLEVTPSAASLLPAATETADAPDHTLDAGSEYVLAARTIILLERIS